jgi:hypothetical protein
MTTTARTMLRKLREDASMSCRELDRRAGLMVNTCSAFERGTRTITEFDQRCLRAMMAVLREVRYTNYPETMRRMRLEVGWACERAGKAAGLGNRYTWASIERGVAHSGTGIRAARLRASTRARIDKVLDMWAAQLASRRLAA